MWGAPRQSVFEKFIVIVQWIATGLPSLIAGLKRQSRMASAVWPAKYLSSSDVACTIVVLPSAFTTNVTVAEPCLPLHLSSAG